MLPPALLFPVESLREAERRARVACGDPFALMAAAGEAAWRLVLQRWPQAQSIVIACGPGNNGGDGYVLARHALESGRTVRVVQLGDGAAPGAGEAARADAEYRSSGGAVSRFATDLPVADLVVDAVFGIGLARAPEGDALALVQAINRHPAPVLALDVPSGVDAETGAVPGDAVAADCTIEFIAPKVGLRTGAARNHVGMLALAPLGLERDWAADLAPACQRMDASALARWRRPRARDSHKGHHGRVLCIGGDAGHGGAILLAAEGALRGGAGLVDVLTRPAHVAPLLARLPEAMAHEGPADGTLDPALLERADVIAAGPGLGRGEWGRMLLDQVLASGRSLVLDADALNLVAAQGLTIPAGSVLTPHPGEASRLLEVSVAEVQGDRLAAARRLAERHRCVVVLKGAGTIVAAPGQLPRLIDAGNPGMAVGGTGDVLTGVVAALLAQGLEAFDAAARAALLHAVAGDIAAAAGERGMLPSDLLAALRTAANPDTRR